MDSFTVDKNEIKTPFMVRKREMKRIVMKQRTSALNEDVFLRFFLLPSIISNIEASHSSSWLWRFLVSVKLLVLMQMS